MGLGIVQIPPEWLRAGAIIGVFSIAALVVSLLWRRIFERLVAKTRSHLDDMILEAFRNLVVWGLIVAGGYYAFLEISIAQKNTVVWGMIGKGFTLAWIALAVATLMRIFNAFSRWRIDHATAHGPEAIRDVVTRVTFVRKLLTVVVMFFAVLYALSVAGVDTSPLVAGGALGGIVIGIALQDTLSNVFAGFFLNIDRPIKIGDFIRLDTNQEGYVEDVGWRYSRVRLIGNNLLIIPNNKLSQSIITNFSLPSQAINVSVACNISYDSDLERVESIAEEVALRVQGSIDGEEGNWKPHVRFKEFGAATISMVTVLRSKEISSQNRIQHEFMKALHKAFTEADIKMH